MDEFRLVVRDLIAGTIWVQLHGDLDAEHAYVFDQELRRAEARDRVHALVLDLRQLAFMDSSGVRALLAARRRAARADRRLVLIEGGPAIRRILRLAGLDDVFELAPDIPSELVPPDTGDPEAGPSTAAPGVCGAAP